MILEQFKQLYHELDRSNIDSIESVYAADIVFTDPFHKVEGINALKTYFSGMYENVKSISFEFGESLREGDSHFVQWDMRLCHPKLNGGREFSVPGATLLKVNVDGQIKFHKDFFDAGAMLYEQVPLLGGLVRTIKKRV